MGAQQDFQITSSGTVRRFYSKGGHDFVSFLEHDGYFEILEKSIEAQLVTAQAQRREVKFTHDDKLRILSLVPGG